MPRTRFTRAERDMIAKLRERHTAEAIYREAQKERSPKTPGAPEHGPGDAISVWACIEVRRAMNHGKQLLSVAEASRRLADDIRPEVSKGRGRGPGRIVGERLGASRLKAMHREVEIRVSPAYIFW